MKTSLSWLFLSRALLGLALALATPAVMPADPAPPAAAPVAAKPPGARAHLLSVEVLQQYDPARRRAIQDALKTVFKEDPAYGTAYQQSDKPLSDQVVGPITLSFIARFWVYYNIEPAGSLTDASVNMLLQFAARLKARDAWRADLVSTRFGRWIDEQPDRVSLYRIRLAVDPLLLPAVLARYRLTLPASASDADSGPLSVYWYGLTQADLIALGTRPVFPAKLLKPLAKLTTYTYETAADLANDVRNELRPSGQDGTALIAQLNILAKTDDGYAVNDELLATLGETTVLPQPLVKLFGDMVGMQYVHRSLFDKAMIQRLRIGLDACPGNFSQEEEIRRKFRLLSQEDVDALRAALDAGSTTGADASLGKQLQALNQTYCNNSGERDQLLARLYDRYRSMIYPYVRKSPDYGNAQPFQLTSDLCGCNTDSMKHQVYHFLPFWLGGPPQKTDFSLMNRLNYYGITFDDSGALRMGGTGQPVASLFTGKNADQLAFVSEARRHRVKVDWVVQRSDWRQWTTVGDKARQAALKRLAYNIVQMLGTPMTDLRSKSVPWLSLGTSRVPVRGDGVTLYFDGYPTDTASVTLFHEFLDELRAQLAKGDFALNIMLRPADIGTGIYRYEKLSTLVPPLEVPTAPALYNWAEDNLQQAFSNKAKEDVRAHLLVLLDEPTTDTKKLLRRKIEGATTGKDRVLLLRALVPVVNFNGLAWAQLEDDLIYFDNNFGGVGFWPSAKTPPADAAPDATPGVDLCGQNKLLDDCLQDYFRNPPGTEDTLVCKFICTNRLPLRFVLDILVLALAAAVFAYVRWCDARPVLRKYYLVPVAALTMAGVIFAGLMTCDPFLNHLGDGLLIPGVLILALIGMYFYFRNLLKERDARP